MTKRPNSIEAHIGPAHPGPDALLDAALHYTATIGVLQSERDGFRQRCDTLQTALDHSTAELAATKDELARLEHVIRQLKRARFGSSSERVDPEPLQLALEGCEQDIAAATAAVTEAAAKVEAAATGAKPKRPPARNRVSIRPRPPTGYGFARDKVAPLQTAVFAVVQQAVRWATAAG